MFEDYGALAPLREAADILADARVAAALRRRPPGRQRGAGRGGDLRRGHVRRARLLRGDRGRASAACGRGSPTSTSTTACAPTARASSAGSSTSRAGGREHGRRPTGPATTSTAAGDAAPAGDARASCARSSRARRGCACSARGTRSTTSPTPPSWSRSTALPARRRGRPRGGHRHAAAPALHVRRARHARSPRDGARAAQPRLAAAHLGRGRRRHRDPRLGRRATATSPPRSAASSS